MTMWPRVDPKDIVHGFRGRIGVGRRRFRPRCRGRARCGGRRLRSVALAVLARHGRKMTLVEVHRELHLNGYAIASRQPVKRLADALGYEVVKGRAVRVERGVYRLGDPQSGRAAPPRTATRSDAELPTPANTGTNRPPDAPDTDARRSRRPTAAPRTADQSEVGATVLGKAGFFSSWPPNCLRIAESILFV